MRATNAGAAHADLNGKGNIDMGRGVKIFSPRNVGAYACLGSDNDRGVMNIDHARHTEARTGLRAWVRSRRTDAPTRPLIRIGSRGTTRATIAAAAGAALLALAAASGPAAAQLTPGAFSEVYGDWRVSCTAAQDAGRRCVIDQHLDWRDEATGQRSRLLSVALSAAGDGAAEATFVIPLGLLLEPGVQLRVDEGAPFRRLPYLACLRDGCVIRGRLDRAAVQLLKKGNTLVIETVSRSRDPLHFEVSLSGFSAAFARLRRAAGQP